MKRIIAALFIGSLLLSAFPVLAQESEGSHDGFFLRFLLGGGYDSFVEKDLLGADFWLSGSAGTFRLQIGGSLAPGFILFGELASTVADNPDVKWGSISGTTSKTEMSLREMGIGICYYFNPCNIYLSGSITAARGYLTYSGTTGSTEMGGGINVAVGKEWYVSQSWGLGVALLMGVHGMKSDEGALGEKTCRNAFIGIAFSATYN